MGSDAARAKNLAELPERHAGQLMGLTDRETALLVEMDRQLDTQLFDRQTSRVQNVLGDLEIGGCRHWNPPGGPQESGLARTSLYSLSRARPAASPKG